MEGLREFLEKVRQNHLVRGHFRALLHVCIGRRISRPDGTVLSPGVTWRQLSELLRIMRWDKELVRELGLDPDELSPRDRQRYWYSTIIAAHVDTAESREMGDAYARLLTPLGFVIGPGPGA
ncbi:MAG TPA: hypothetical protein VHR66_29620 [Gemmataceae bacterium]|jgi:hypothetical protein|nr:hypothetical protein [Gemmataceae bacterium]